MAGEIFEGEKMKRRKTWREKLEDSKGLPKVEKIEGRLSKRWGKGTVVIPAPKEVDEIMRMVPEGKIITINKIREILAKKHNATIGCPITTGIFSWISAHAAEEARANGEKFITPWWRTLKSNGELNEKFPGGVEKQRELLEAEGHVILRKEKKLFVRDFEKLIFEPEI